MVVTLGRLGVPAPKPKAFLLQKVDRVKRALEDEEKWLVPMQAEVAAKEARATFLCSTLDQ